MTPRSSDEDRAASAEQRGSDAATVVELAGVRLAFGLEWHPVTSAGNLPTDLRLARESGYRWVARLPDHGVIGLSRRVDGPRRAHAAVALLVARFAERGAEACLIALPGAGVAEGRDQAGPRVAFVGLMDRVPAPGFDRLLPDLGQALTVLQEFRDMHPDQTVRVASYLPGQAPIGEALVPDFLFDRPDPDTRLRALSPPRWPATLAMGAVTLGLLAGFTMWLRHEQALKQAAIEAAHRRSEAAATRAQAGSVREQALNRLLADAGRPGPATLDRWRAAIAALPLSRVGWTLQQIDCDRATGCTATWARHHGTLAGLDALSDGALGPPTMRADLAAGGDALASPMKTPLAGTAETPPRDSEALVAARLPPLRLALNLWGSRLQDLTTVGGAETLLRPGAPLGAASAPTAAAPPADTGRHLVRMTWWVKDGLWSLPLIQVPPYVIVDSLTLTFSAAQVTYELSGSLFAHGTRY